MTQETAARKEKSQVTKQRMKILNNYKIASVLMPYMGIYGCDNNDNDNNYC